MDVLEVIQAFRTTNTQADVNGDGSVEERDLMEVWDNLGACGSTLLAAAPNNWEAEMPNETPRATNVIHLLVADLSRTACQMPATPALSSTTIADNATCEQCRRNSGR